MSSEPWPLFATLCGALWLDAACADFSRGEPLAGADGSSPGSVSDAGSSVAFGADLHALLQEGCASCHSARGAASNTELVYTGSVEDDYESTLRLVSPDAPKASRLVVKMTGRGHAGGTIYTEASSEYALVLSWIGEGVAP